MLAVQAAAHGQEIQHLCYNLHASRRRRKCMPAVQTTAHKLDFTPYAPIDQNLGTSCSCSCTKTASLSSTVLLSHAGDEQDDSIFPMLPVPSLCTTYPRSIDACLQAPANARLSRPTAKLYWLRCWDTRTLGDDASENSGNATYDSGQTLAARLRRQ